MKAGAWSPRPGKTKPHAFREAKAQCEIRGPNERIGRAKPRNASATKFSKWMVRQVQRRTLGRITERERKQVKINSFMIEYGNVWYIGSARLTRQISNRPVTSMHDF